MKNTLTKIVYLLVICFALNVLTDGAVMTDATAAPATTSSAKAKAKAKAQKAKAKEKAKKNKAKAKAKAKKQQQAAKAQKAKAAQAAQSAKAADKQDSKQSLSPTELYEQQVQEVTAYNERVARYMTRDIDHRLGIWGQVGYSAILPSKFAYSVDPATNIATGYNAAAKGWIGGGGGFGYQLRYQEFLFTIGAEFQMYNSKTSLYDDNKKEPVMARSFDTKYPLLGYPIRYDYRFEKMLDMYQAGYVQIPVLFGMEFADHQGYFLVGPKVGLNMIHTTQLAGTMHTRGVDKELIDNLENMPNHGFSSKAMTGEKHDVKFGLNVAAAAEVGWCLDRYMQPRIESGKKPTAGQRMLAKMHTRVALFAEYGVLNIQQKENAQPSDAVNGGLPVRNLGQIGKEEFASSLKEMAAVGAVLNPFMVGVKLTMMWDLPRKNLKPMPMPKEPTPRMAARVINAESQSPLAGSVVTIAALDGSKATSKTTNSQGYINVRLPKGEYTVKAEKRGFFADSTVYNLQRDLSDTTMFALVPVPTPIVYTYCARVYAGDTQQPVEADVTINTTTDSTVIYSGSTADDGLFVTDLLKGDYVTHIRYAGYMPLDASVHFEQDTLSFYLTKIKEGIRVKINNLFFATNKTFILPESEEAMEKLATFLRENEAVSIRIIGHTDSIGSDRANQILSEGRANSVRNDLIKRGIAADRIEAEGRGESEPVDTNSTEQGRANNRRVEFVITATDGEDIHQVYDN